MTSPSNGAVAQVGRREFIGLGLGAFVAASVPFVARRPYGLVQRTVPVMGTIARFAVAHRSPAVAHAAIDAAVAELLWVERTMTRFTDTSDIGRANLHAAHDAVGVSAATALVTAEAVRWASAVDGRYDPAIGAVMALWDVKHRHEPPPAERVAELAGRRFHRGVEVGTSGGGAILRFHDAGARLDLGSIAKGYGVDRAAQALRERGIAKALVVAGGDLYAIGTGPDDEPWTIGIQSPTDERALAGTLQLADQAVATSGTYRQYFRHRGRRYHHLMNPETAEPRVTTVQSLTVVADSVMHADAATTALFGLGEEEIGRALVSLLPGAHLARIL